MEVIPAIDLLDGKVVRLTRGQRNSRVIYSEKPLKVLREYFRKGARIVHVVDLNAALGKGNNRKLITQLARNSPLKLQVGGGIRSLEAADEVLRAGAEKVILGTIATNPATLKKFTERFGIKILVAVDIKNGKAAVEGWEKNSRLGQDEYMIALAKQDFGGIIFTDVSRDGTLSGISKNFFRRARRATSKPAYASGGITALEDLKWLSEAGFDGAIIGKAIYEGRIDLRESIKVVKDVG